jgi:hypothetical protein
MFIPLLLMALPVAFWLIKRSAEKQEPVSDGATLEFPLTRGMRFLIGSVVIALIGFSALVLGTALVQGFEGWYAVFIPLAVLLAILTATPGKVVLDHDGIRQHRWLFRDKTIAWHEIARGGADGEPGPFTSRARMAAVQFHFPLCTLAGLTLNSR